LVLLEDASRGAGVERGRCRRIDGQGIGEPYFVGSLFAFTT
jgi:hypothetical protein